MLVALATVVPITLLAVEWTLDLAAHQRSEVESLGRGVQELRASLERSLAGSLRALLAAEDARPVLHYTADTLLPPANGLPLRRSPTPLATAFGPAAPLAFFSTDANWSQRAEGAVGPVRCCFWLPHPELATLLPDDRDRRALYGVVDRRVRAWVETRGSSLFQWGWLATPEFREERSPQLALAAFVFDAETDPFLREENDELLQQLVSGLSGLDAPLLIGPCRAEVSEPESDRPQFLVVSRLVLPVDEAPLQEVGRVAGGLRQFHLTLAHVDAPLRLTLLQGATYALEPLLQSWARSWAQEQLGTAQSLEFGPSTRPTLGRIDLDLVQAAGLSAVGAPPGQAGLTPPSLPATLTIDPRGLQRRHRVEWIVLAVGLAVSAAVGGSLLAAGLKDLQRRLRQADRTSNFVAAVTHEFRTPLSTIALHAEMLLEGWTVDPEQRQEYYRRIANETTRLSRLVERILEQSQLSRGRTQAPAAEPELGDLNAAVKAVIPSLGPERRAGSPTCASSWPTDCRRCCRAPKPSRASSPTWSRTRASTRRRGSVPKGSSHCWCAPASPPARCGSKCWTAGQGFPRPSASASSRPSTGSATKRRAPPLAPASACTWSSSRCRPWVDAPKSSTGPGAGPACASRSPPVEGPGAKVNPRQGARGRG
jgi:hypothetical protein